MSDILELQKKVIEFVEERDWAQFHSPKDMAMGLNIEAGELMELFLYKKNEDILKEYKDKGASDLSEELADVIFWSLYIADAFGIDLKEACLDKFKKNSERYPVEKSKGSYTKHTEL